MSGERGLNLSSLDKLAIALGLEIVVSVQNVPRPSPKGRRPNEEKQLNATATKKISMAVYWNGVASGLAKDASEKHFESRRGVWYIKPHRMPDGRQAQGVTCLYDTCRYRNSSKRAEETLEFRRRTKAAGLKELGYATYPPEGEANAGYTYALVIDGEHNDWVANAMNSILRESMAEEFGQPEQDDTSRVARLRRLARKDGNVLKKSRTPFLEQGMLVRYWLTNDRNCVLQYFATIEQAEEYLESE
jgi:hypothetical protein